MNNITKQTLSLVLLALLTNACTQTSPTPSHPDSLTLKGIALNPEGIEYNKNDGTFLLSSLNAQPIVKVNSDGTYTTFSSGEKFPLSTAGLHVDYNSKRLLVAGFNGMELMDNKPETKGVSFLRIYDLSTGILQKEVNLSSLAPKASAYFANDVTVDDAGNIYISDWYANLVYKVDTEYKATLFWQNNTAVKGGPNGIDVHPDGYLLVSLLSLGKTGLYENYGLVKIALDNPINTTQVVVNEGFAGFDGMVIKENGNIIGVTNNQKTPGGNILMELTSSDAYKTAKLLHSKPINPSTTVTLTPQGEQFVIEQDFSQSMKKEWKIQKVSF